MLSRFNPFARARVRAARIDTVVDALECAAAAAEAERARLADATEVGRAALLLLHRTLSDWADQPARAAAAAARLEVVADQARADLHAAAGAIGQAARDGVAAELAPARDAAEAHAAHLRASLDRMRGEATALRAAEDAAAALVALATGAQGTVVEVADALARRVAQAADTAERASMRLQAVADRAERPTKVNAALAAS